jgi:hypothetical protein
MCKLRRQRSHSLCAIRHGDKEDDMSVTAAGSGALSPMDLSMPARLKEWAYAGFAITRGSALIAHLAVGGGPEAWGWAAGTGLLWALSYVSWRRLQAVPSKA